MKNVIKLIAIVNKVDIFVKREYYNITKELKG